MNTNHMTGGTLCIDVGGSSITGLVLDQHGRQVSERVRIRTLRQRRAA